MFEHLQHISKLGASFGTRAKWPYLYNILLFFEKKNLEFNMACNKKLFETFEQRKYFEILQGFQQISQLLLRTLHFA